MKRLAMLVCAVASALLVAACSGFDQPPPAQGTQASTDAQPATPVEGTTAVDESGVVPVTADAISSANLSGQPCSLDSIDGNFGPSVALEKGEPHVLRGWLASPGRAAAGKFELVLVSEGQGFGIPATTGTLRPDVAEGLQAPALADAGFNISTTLSSVPAGSYQARFLMAAEGGASFWCDAGKTIEVR